MSEGRSVAPSTWAATWAVQICLQPPGEPSCSRFRPRSWPLHSCLLSSRVCSCPGGSAPDLCGLTGCVLTVPSGHKMHGQHPGVPKPLCSRAWMRALMQMSNALDLVGCMGCAGSACSHPSNPVPANATCNQRPASNDHLKTASTGTCPANDALVAMLWLARSDPIPTDVSSFSPKRNRV